MIEGCSRLRLVLMSLLFCSLLVAMLGSGCATHGCGGTGTPPCTCVKTVKVADLISAPEKYATCGLRVTGLLVNKGKNYFTDLRVYLRDGDREIRVRPWLPFEVPPAPPGREATRPMVQSDFLGRKVTIEGSLREHKADIFSGTGYYLEVRSAVLADADTTQGK